MYDVDVLDDMNRPLMLYDDHSDIFQENNDGRQREMSTTRFSNRVQIEISISISTYMKYLLYHILYFLLLGPLLCVFYIIRDRSYRYVFYNMSMYCRNNLSYYVQMFNWMCMIIAYYMYINDISYNRYEIVYSMMIHIVLRISSISGKYSTFSDKQLRMINSVYVTEQEMNKEYMMVYWRKQDEKVTKECIIHALHTSCIQTTTLMLSFFRKPKQYTIDSLNTLYTDRSTIDDYNNKMSILCLEEREYYKGDLIYHYIIKKMNSMKKISGMRLTVLFLCIRLLIPAIIDIILIPDYMSSFSFSDAVYIILCELNICFFVFVNIWFYLQAYTDILRKQSIINQLNRMADMYRESKDISILPTVNLIDIQSMYTWRSLYTINQEYGKKFFIRHKIYIPFVIILMMVDSILLALTMLYIRKRTHNIDDNSSMIYIMMIRIDIDLMLYYVMTVIILYISSDLNDKYNKPTDILKKLIYTIDNIRIFKDLYIYNNRDDTDEIDIIHTLLCNEIRYRYAGDKDTFDNSMITLSKYYRTLYESFEYERKNCMIKVFGVRVTKQIIYRTSAIVIPILLAVQNKLIEMGVDIYCKYPNRC